MDTEQLDRLSTLFKALAEPARLRILGLLAEKPLAGHELAERLALTPPTISHHMRRLTEAGLIHVTSEAQSRIYSLRGDAFDDWVRRPPPLDDTVNDTSEEAAVIRAFFDGARLRHLPASRKKRVIVLCRLLEQFEPNKTYPEQEVNNTLRLAHDDVASLRRELVDYGFMVRERGVYRLASELPVRGPTVRQEVVNEQLWFQKLVAAETKRAVLSANHITAETLAAPRE